MAACGEDRTLRYEIDVATTDGRALRFSGSTTCVHDPSGVEGSRFRTLEPMATLTEAGETWRLGGINCDNEIVDRRRGAYTLYRKTGPASATAWFMVADGPARLGKATFDVRVPWFGKSRAAPGMPYGAGPYMYQKVAYLDAPPAVAGQARAVVVSQAGNPCGKANAAALEFTREELASNFGRLASMASIEEGALAHQPATGTWRPVVGADPGKPMDVAAAAETPGCIRLELDGRTHAVSDNADGSYLYVPAERALYRIARVTREVAERYLRQKVRWPRCPRPEVDLDFRPGVMYRVDLAKRSAVARMNADGSFSCQNGFSWLGAGS